MPMSKTLYLTLTSVARLNPTNVARLMNFRVMELGHVKLQVKVASKMTRLCSH